MVEVVEEGDLLDRAAGQPGRERLGRVAGDDERRRRQLGGDPEQLLDLRLEHAQQRRQRRRHALVAQGEAEVLDGRVDRRAADDAQAAEVGVGRMGVGEVGQDDDDRRVVGEVLGEVVGGGERLRRDP